MPHPTMPALFPNAQADAQGQARRLFVFVLRIESSYNVNLGFVYPHYLIISAVKLLKNPSPTLSQKAKCGLFYLAKKVYLCIYKLKNYDYEIC